GKPYLNEHLPNMTFDDARHSGLTDVTQKKIQRFYKNHVKGDAPALKGYGVHMRDAAELVLGLTTGIHAIFKAGDAPPKASNRIPPRWNS
ncbi:MAG: hypothetical protein K0R10_2938, partial [Alphaproteobacteria bacterium]|nr:hypothetical protein [Alphaproteobacteria bacterium]